MKQFIIAAAILAATSMSALAAGGNTGGNTGGNCSGNVCAAPGPLMGAGPVGWVIGGVGYGVYWVVKRRRRKTTEV
jgi:hypothetical protein